MENIILHEFVIPVKGVKKKVLYHFSDCHLTEYDEMSLPEETEKAKKQTAAWLDVRSGFAYAHGEPYGEEQKLTAAQHFENLAVMASHGDCAVLAGDILDYENTANFRTAERILNKITCPYVMVCGNHEHPEGIPDGFSFSVMKKDIQKVEFDDLTVLGFNNSKRTVTREMIDALNTELSKGKTVIVAMHVPIMTEKNKEALTKAGVYFQLNYEGCPAENLEFIDVLKNNSKQIAAVLAGHLHFNNVTDITDGLTQYVSSQGITGNINRYIIGE